MKNRLAKKAVSFAMAAVLSFTSIAAYAEEVSDTEGVNGIDFEIYSNWGIEDHAENIKETYKLDYPEQAGIIDEIVDVISGSEEFAGIFEEEGEAAFRIIEDSLQDVLRPSESPCDNTDELYFSKYDVELIRQSSTDMNAAAATAMALKGSGVLGYTQVIVQNRFNTYTTTPETINKITKLLRNDIPDKNGYSVKTRAFIPISGSDCAYHLIYCIEVALSMDTVPVIQVEGDYYGGGSGKRYLAATCVDVVAECITVLDPVGKKSLISFDEWDDLLAKSGVIWVSAYGNGNKGYAGLAQMMGEYPNDSYYNTTGVPCTCHDWCNWNSDCTCIKYKNENGVSVASQCAGFARQVFDIVMGRSYSSSSTTRKKTINQTMTESTAKKYLKGRAVGTHANVKTNGADHYISIISTSETDITVYQANLGGGCRVSYKTYTWKEFASIFPYLYYYVD